VKEPKKKPLDSHTLSCWRTFANQLLCYNTSIRIWRNEDKWREELARIFGDASTAIECGYYRKKDSCISINLYCSELQHLEELFKTFIHELGHAYLRQKGKPTVGWEAESDTELWSLVNFDERISVVAKAVYVLKWERPMPLHPSAKATNKDISELNSKYGERAIIEESSFVVLDAWVDGLKSRADEILAWQEEALQYWKKARE